MSEEPKACPFCGGEPFNMGGDHWVCSNDDCEVGRPDNYLSFHISEWNKRYAPEGYALVPVEPSEEMIHEIEHSSRLGGIWTVESIYKAMIAAATETK